MDLEMDHRTANQRPANLMLPRLSTATPVLVTMLLLAAAALKAHQLLWLPSAGSFWGTLWFPLALIEVELLLAGWLISGVQATRCRRAVLVAFVVFAAVSLRKALSGAATCNCFGNLQVHPWLTFSLDLVVVALLVVWRPARDASDAVHSSGHAAVRSYATALLMFVVSAAMVAAPLAVLFRSQPTDGNYAALPDGALAVVAPEKWLGEKCPLLDEIDLGQKLAQGSWTVVLIHHDCPACQEVVTYYARASAQERGERSIALIEIPPYGPVQRPSTPITNGRLSERLSWFVSTPLELSLDNGFVTSLRTNEELHLEALEK